MSDSMVKNGTLWVLAVAVSSANYLDNHDYNVAYVCADMKNSWIKVKETTTQIRLITLDVTTRLRLLDYCDCSLAKYII